MQYLIKANLNLYTSPKLNSLATQAEADRRLTILSSPQNSPLQVRLCEDDYPGWLAAEDSQFLEASATLYQAPVWSEAEIQRRIAGAIAFTRSAMAVPNYYLWGGTVAPNYDCSGLMQAAFASAGIRLPRDAYQQEEFVRKIALSDLMPGDLVFFGTPIKATHVGLYLGNDRYIHSSGKDQGRNGIGIDELSDRGNAVSRTYYAQVRGAGRVVESYQPKGLC
ncbi:glycoside hydrolase [Phormidesmis priestleyi ULC007]|uniref:Glycoside hydrolase n=1 Tax=Phormidesmis priestleyi ULC007 TaxID=1920490 RepID=A0A2T1DLV2_9CYAN|nr:C40 family peptidase [Phormidesmis priestleyi]PSB21456.1 glycoside hydrolase [Phormidesmis priestleyi ULC007]PZO46710.1 MAG: glycoside hydrolase [Phormidesmis priestleyi]